MQLTRAPARRRIASVVVLLAVISPALRDRDSFPLSTYPVYASARPREMTIETAVGERDDARVVRLPMATIAATDDPLIAQQRVKAAVTAGRAGQLCERIASRVSADVTTVMVVRERHDAVRAARGEPSLLDRTVHARCPVSPAGQ